MTVGRAIWPDQLDDAERAALQPGLPEQFDRNPDVLIVGGGIMGCATAAACVRAGLGSVVLVEREARLGAGASGGAAGLLMPEAHVGVDPPEFVDMMRLSLEAWRELDASWPGGVGLVAFDRLAVPQARVNPLRSIARVAAQLPSVATGVEVRGVTEAGAVHTNLGELKPRALVFATGLPPRVEGLQLDIPAGEVKGHMLASAATNLRLPPELTDLARQIEDGRIIVGGTLDLGDDERVVRPQIVKKMWDELAAVWPPARDLAVEYSWACFRPAHPDHLPVIDRLPTLDNAWMTSGQYKTGILMAPATGCALATWITTGSAPRGITPFGLGRLLVPR